MKELRPDGETPENRLKRLKMRSWRRGIKEMDIILGGFADARLAELSPEALEAYEALLDENDQDLYKWVSGGAPRPAAHTEMLQVIANFHGIDA